MYQKFPRSPIPSTVKTPKSDSEAKKKPYTLPSYEGTLPVRLLADVDSLFTTCQGFMLHYKISMPGSPPRSLSSTTFVEPSRSFAPQLGLGRVKLDRPLSAMSKTQHHLHRSYSNLFHSSSLYDPLLDIYSSSTVVADEIPPLSLDATDDKDEVQHVSLLNLDLDLEVNAQSGIVLVHGFGGGVFSWRHVMGTLARQVGCPVAAFDRPGWGLTPRLQRKDWEKNQLPNPYKLETQVSALVAVILEVFPPKCIIVCFLFFRFLQSSIIDGNE